MLNKFAALLAFAICVQMETIGAQNLPGVTEEQTELGRRRSLNEAATIKIDGVPQLCGDTNEYGKRVYSVDPKNDDVTKIKNNAVTLCIVFEDIAEKVE